MDKRLLYNNMNKSEELGDIGGSQCNCYEFVLQAKKALANKELDYVYNLASNGHASGYTLDKLKDIVSRANSELDKTCSEMLNKSSK